MSTGEDNYTSRLVVIVHADIVDSTRLVQKNEITAHVRIQEVFNRFSRIITSYNGIVHEIRGDALVAEFHRASDSLCAALNFQVENRVYNENLCGDIRPELRIGISLGEVVIADRTITGPGVVLAQRLEQLASPGGVVVQGSVSETVPGRLPFDYESLGEQNLKGFDQPVRAYSAVVKSGYSIPDPVIVASNLNKKNDEDSVYSIKPESSRPSIAVLPFDNMSGDSDQKYFFRWHY